MEFKLQTFEEWAKANYHVERNIFTESDELSVNGWSIEDWCQVSGIGPTLAQRIMECAPFEKLDEVKQVKGVSQKAYNSLLEICS